MSLPAALGPDRTMVFPFAAVLFPVLWFVYRGATGVEGTGVSLSGVLGPVAAAVVGSYAVAAVVSAAVGPASEWTSGWLEPLFAPSNATLAVVAVVSVLLGAFLLVDALVDVPRWLVTVLAPFGVAIGWPVLVAIAATYAVGNAFGTELPFLVQAGFLAVGIVCAVAWLFVASSWLVSLASGVDTVGRSQTS